MVSHDAVLASTERVTVPVTAGQFPALSAGMLTPDGPIVTHKLAIGPFHTPGVWVVTGAQSRDETQGKTYSVTLTRVDF